MKELLHSQELNRRILEVFPGGLVYVEADGAIRKANEEAIVFLGLSWDDLTSRYTSDFAQDAIFEDGRPCPVEEYPVTEAIVTGQRAGPLTLGVTRPDGAVSWGLFTAVPTFEDGEITGAVVTILDLTHWKQVEAARAESEARLRSVLRSAPNAILAADRDGVITFINSTAPGLSVEEVVGRSMFDYVRAEDHERVRGHLQSALETRTVQSYEIVSPEALDCRIYSVSLGPIVIDGEAVGVTAVTADVTENRRLQARLIVSDRLASIGTLAAGVAHEINNPLTYLQARLELLEQAQERGAVDPAYLRDSLVQIREGVDRISRVVQDIGSFARPDEVETEPTDVHAVLESSLRMARNELRYRAQVVRDFGEVDPVLANPSRLGQVFLNLLVNAAHAIPEGDVDHNRVTVTTRPAGDGHLVVSISDTGTGIPGELLTRIFDPYFSTKPSELGMGLGLYLSRQIIDELGGELTVDSRQGEGSSFEVRLPTTPCTRTEEDELSDHIAVPTRRILVVDDEPHIRQLIEIALADHDVLSAGSGREAQALLAEHTVDLVLCDLVMPAMTGMDLYESLQGDPIAERFVFITGGAFTERARRFLGSVDRPVLAKPFRTADVQKLVAEALFSFEP